MFVKINEIVYAETGRFSLRGGIKCLQLKFWLFVTTQYIVQYPETALAKVLLIGMDANYRFFYYKVTTCNNDI